jgi:hypothetical protein
MAGTRIKHQIEALREQFQSEDEVTIGEASWIKRLKSQKYEPTKPEILPEIPEPEPKRCPCKGELHPIYTLESHVILQCSQCFALTHE